MNETHSRAKSGGQIGANGEWYTGGQFIATTERPKGSAKQRKSAGRVQTGPYLWEPAREGFRSLYQDITLECSKMDGSVFLRAGLVEWSTPALLARRMSAIERWNAGERWVKV